MKDFHIDGRQRKNEEDWGGRGVRGGGPAARRSGPTLVGVRGAEGASEGERCRGELEAGAAPSSCSWPVRPRVEPRCWAVFSIWRAEHWIWTNAFSLQKWLSNANMQKCRSSWYTTEKTFYKLPLPQAVPQTSDVTSRGVLRESIPLALTGIIQSLAI